MAKSPEEMVALMVENLKEKTGKSLDQWLKIAKAAKLTKHKELVDHLKAKYGVGHGYANLIVAKTLEPTEGAASGDDLVTAQYEGAKAALRPTYDALISAVSKFGTDIEVSPKKAYVSLRRSKQFALIQPSTATRIDVGINLKSKPPTARLEASGGFNSMVSHRVRLENVKGVDAELIGWLKEAYSAS